MRAMSRFSACSWVVFSSEPVASLKRSSNSSFSWASSAEELGVAEVAHGLLRHQNPSSRSMIRALIGSFWMARFRAPGRSPSSG